MINHCKMRQIAGLFFISVILSAGFVSCKKEKDPGPDFGYNYFPEKVGSYVIYNVDSFYYYNTPTIIDTFKFQLKEKIQSTYPDNQNRTTLRLERYVRNYDPLVPYSALPWLLRDVWAANRTTSTAEKVEENVRYVKLAFAVREGKSWNGNAQNVNEEMLYNYQFFDQPRTIGGASFDSVLQVNQINYEDLISKHYSIERYARRTGMVFKHYIEIDSQPNSDWGNPMLYPFGNDSLVAFYEKPIMERVTSGVQYSYAYTSSGIE